MIDEYFKKLNTTIASVSMTEDERARVRGALVTEMAKAPLGRFDTLIETTAWYFSTINYRRIVAAATTSAFLFTMGGVSYAAEASLPGDKLYVVKTDFNEAVVEFLAVSDKDKAKVQTEFAQKRLEEASQLAAEGRLNQERKDIVSEKLKEHVSAVKEELDQIVGREDFVSAVEVATEFEATVRAHTDVLVALVEQPAPEPVETPDSSEEGTNADGESTNDSGLAMVDTAETSDVSLMAASAGNEGASARMVQGSATIVATDSVVMTPENVVSFDLVSSVIADVADVVAEITVVREQAQNAVADSMLVSKRTLAEEKRAELEAVVSDVERALSSTSTLVTEVASSASSTLMSIREGITTGNTAFNESRFDDAFRTYNEALLAARELDEKVSALADLPRQVIVTTPVVVIPQQQEVAAPVEPQAPVVAPQPTIDVPTSAIDALATTTASSTPSATATTTATTTVSVQTDITFGR